MHRVIVLTTWLAAAIAPPAHAKLDVFACEPEWAALTRTLGGDDVSVYQATTALQDPHRIEARPSLIAHMRGAKLVICTGAELEIGWLPVLLQTAGNSRVQPGTDGFLAAADYVQRLEVPTVVDRSGGDIHPAGNPHIQLDPHNIAKVADVLATRLASLDAANASAYAARNADFQTHWRDAITRWEAEATPLKGMRLVPYHKGDVYLIHWLGMVEVMDIEPKPGIPPSAGYLTELVGRIKREGADAITRSTYVDPKAARWLSEHTGVPLVDLPYTVGGTPAAKDLYGLFDDTIARLLKVRDANAGH
jgi:zinc/manganese transport system substrate-binding protein